MLWGFSCQFLEFLIENSNSEKGRKIKTAIVKTAQLRCFNEPSADVLCFDFSELLWNHGKDKVNRAEVDENGYILLAWLGRKMLVKKSVLGLFLHTHKKNLLCFFWCLNSTQWGDSPEKKIEPNSNFSYLEVSETENRPKKPAGKRDITSRFSTRSHFYTCAQSK